MSRVDPEIKKVEEEFHATKEQYHELCRQYRAAHDTPHDKSVGTLTTVLDLMMGATSVDIELTLEARTVVEKMVEQLTILATLQDEKGLCKEAAKSREDANFFTATQEELENASKIMADAMEALEGTKATCTVLLSDVPRTFPPSPARNSQMSN